MLLSTVRERESELKRKEEESARVEVVLTQVFHAALHYSLNAKERSARRRRMRREENLAKQKGASLPNAKFKKGEQYPFVSLPFHAVLAIH